MSPTVLLVMYSNALYMGVYTDICCIVPFEEDPKDPSVWFLDHNYVEAMNDMFKKVNGNYLHLIIFIIYKAAKLLP